MIYIFAFFCGLPFLNAFDLKQPSISHIYFNKKWEEIKDNKSYKLEALDEDIRFRLQNTEGADSVFVQLVQFENEPRITRDNEHRYPNLKGGDYTFCVWSKKDSITSQKAELKLSIDNALTETWWFWPSIILYVFLLAGAILYFWMMYNFRQKMRVQNIRHQIAGDLHDEVGSTLSSISVFTKTLRRDFAKTAPEALPILDKILASSQETIINLRDTVWAIQPENDGMDKLLEKMRDFAYQVLMAQDIYTDYDNNYNPQKPMRISMEQRRNVYLMFKEAINNIIKHSEATRAVIKITQEKEGIRLHIKDNGKGFDPLSLNGDGNGLKNFDKRAKESFIQFDLKSKPGEGTEIMFFVPEI